MAALHMNPGVNIDEPIGKVVGRRRQSPSPFGAAAMNPQPSQQWRKAFGGIPIPKGVYRFRTHQEADEWLWKMITRPRPS